MLFCAMTLVSVIDFPHLCDKMLLLVLCFRYGLEKDANQRSMHTRILMIDMCNASLNLFIQKSLLPTDARHFLQMPNGLFSLKAQGHIW
jgi:hypothetical protein